MKKREKGGIFRRKRRGEPCGKAQGTVTEENQDKKRRKEGGKW